MIDRITAKQRPGPGALHFEGCAHTPDLRDALVELVELRSIRGSDNRQEVSVFPETRNLPLHVDRIDLDDRA
jgi:hypothetical protein